MIDIQVPGPLTNEQEKKIYKPSEKWSDEFALKVATADFNYAETYRTSNLDYRWANADQLYLAFVQTRYWEGTRIPRANIGVYTAFEQIESFLPKIVTAIFSDYPNWFQIEARPGTAPDAARAVSNLMLYQMENLNSHGISTIRDVFRRCVKSAFIYGNGICELCWLNKQEQRFYTYRQQIPEMMPVNHPLFGPQQIPTGKMKSVVKQEQYTEKTNQPFLRYRSLKDFYVDPNCPSPIVSDARYIVDRKLLTVDEVASYRGQEYFKVPNDEDLSQLAKNRPVAQGDYTKAMGEANRQMWWQPQIDSSTDPASKRIEVLRYVTKDRDVWVLDRSHVAYNQPNAFGFIPYYDWFYVDVLDRFYGLAITDVVEGEQRLQSSIINSRIDELALSLNKPMIKRRGLSIPPGQLKSRPGQVIEADNPKEDIVIGQVNNITQEAYIEVQASDTRVQKITGGSDLAILGTPSSGGNSANRTATGVGAQVQATGSRTQYQVENNEDTAIEAILADWHTLNQRFLDPQQIVEAIGQQGQAIQIDPLTIMNARVKFSMRASAKMQARTGLLQTWPLIMQSLTNPGFMQQLASMGKTINWIEMQNMLMDATGYRNKEALFTDMSEEEKQAMNQPPQADMIRMQMQRERIAGQKDIAEDKQLADMTKEVLKGSLQHQATVAETEAHDLQVTKQKLMEKAMDHRSAMEQKQFEADHAPEPKVGNGG
jgi:hypothetical protein